MKSIRIKVFALLFALTIGCIAVPRICQYSYADTENEAAVVIVETGVEYSSLGEANEAMPKEGQTIKLLKDIDLGNTYFLSGKNLTLDLNGHTITSSASSEYEYQRHGTVTLAGDWARKGKIIDSSAEKNGTIINTGNGYAVFTGIHYDITIEEGIFKSNSDGIMCGSDVIINGGKIEAGGYALDHFKANNIVTINGGVIKGGSSTFRFVKWNDDHGGGFAINGGYYSDDRGNGDRVSRKAGTRLFKVGGTGEYKDYWELKTIVAKRISGGSETEYADLQEAVSASAAGDQVVVMADCETDSLLINKGITLDLNGKTITEKGVMKLKSGSMTIKDSSATESTAGSGRIEFTKEDGNYTFDVIGSSTKLLLESGTLNADKSGAIRAAEGAEVDMTGGTVSAGKCGVYVGVHSSSVYEGKAIISGGTITGSEYGIFVHNGSATVSGETSFVGSEGKSVGVEEDQEFLINGGKFSDDAGNADGFTRADGKYLCRSNEGDVPVYLLGTPEAFNENTGEYIEKLEDAVDQLSEDGHVIKAMKDIDLGNEAVYVLHTLVLDLNGHTITSGLNERKKGTLCLTNEAELTIKDSSEEKTGAIINNYSGSTEEGFAVWTDENTKLIIEGGTIKSNNTGAHCGETIIMNGGKIDAGGRGIYLFPFDSAVTINDGVLKCGDEDPTFYFPYNRPGPEVTINGGYFSNTSSNDDDRISRKDGMILLKVGGSGEYKDYYMLKKAIAKLVSGESETIYDNLLEAINDATEDDKVVMLDNCETDCLLIDKNITLDLNGKTITEISIMKAASGTLTIEDSSASEGAAGTGTISFTIENENGAFNIINGAHLLLKGGILDAPKSTAVRVMENSKATIEGGTVSGGKSGIYVGGMTGAGNEAIASITGGTISGAEYGIYLLNGVAGIPQDSKVFVSSEGKSVGMRDGQIFGIDGGKFSDAAGNADEYLRPANKYLTDQDKDGWYELTDKDKTALEDSIAAAEAAEEGVAVSTDGSDVDPAKQWTTAAEKKALDDAIAAAQAVADDDGATQKEIDEATEAVSVATETYNNAKKNGTKPEYNPGGDPGQKGQGGTPVGPGASEASADRAITSSTSEEGPAGTMYAPVALRSTKQGKNSVTLSWNKVKGAGTYVVYGNACGKNYRMKKLATLKTNKFNVKKISKKLKKGTYHKFIVVALDANRNVISTSKVIHVATKGGKVTNYRKVSISKSVVSKAKKLKSGKTLKLKARQIRQGAGKVKKHRALKYESSNAKIATVSKKGVVKARAKGSCYVYAYAQNGVYKRVKVTVK